MVNDISNLFSKFGANASGYLEVEDSIDYKHVPKTSVSEPNMLVNSQASMNDDGDRTPILAEDMEPAPQTDDVVHRRHSVTGRVEPVAGGLPALVDAISAMPSAMASNTATSTLRSLLSEVVQQRQAEARSRGEEVSSESVPDGLPPATPAQVIAIVSPKGGVGKSTICAALAGALLPKGRVIAIDLDQQNALQFHMGVSLLGPDTNDSGSATGSWISLLRNGVGGTYVLPYTSISGLSNRAFEQSISDDKHWLSRQLGHMNLDAHDVVLLDTPAGHAICLEQVLDVADQTVLIITPDPASFVALDHIDQLFERKDNVSYIVNQFDASRTFCVDMLEVFKRRLKNRLIGVVPLDHSISEGLVYGLNSLLIDELSPARQAIEVISDVLKSHMEIIPSTDACAS